jgi:hypothetical protein
VDAESTDAVLAKEAIDRIRALYEIERPAKDLGDEQRLALRTAETRPRLDELRTWLELTGATVLPKSPMAKAVGSALRQWEALTVFATDGRLSIDNNSAEQALRPFAVGRNNWLFFQRDTGGKTAAVLANLLRTSIAIGVDPRTYFRDVLVRIAHEPDVSKLTPHGWKQRFARSRPSGKTSWHGCSRSSQRTAVASGGRRGCHATLTSYPTHRRLKDGSPSACGRFSGRNPLSASSSGAAGRPLAPPPSASV